jgi:hypothetical protein
MNYEALSYRAASVLAIAPAVPPEQVKLGNSNTGLSAGGSTWTYPQKEIWFQHSYTFSMKPEHPIFLAGSWLDLEVCTRAIVCFEQGGGHANSIYHSFRFTLEYSSLVRC